MKKKPAKITKLAATKRNKKKVSAIELLRRQIYDRVLEVDKQIGGGSDRTIQDQLSDLRGEITNTNAKLLRLIDSIAEHFKGRIYEFDRKLSAFQIRIEVIESNQNLFSPTSNDNILKELENIRTRLFMLESLKIEIPGHMVEVDVLLSDARERAKNQKL